MDVILFVITARHRITYAVKNVSSWRLAHEAYTHLRDIKSSWKQLQLVMVVSQILV